MSDFRPTSRRRAAGPPDETPVWKTIGLVLVAVAVLVGVVTLYRVLDPRDPAQRPRSGRPQTLGLSGLTYSPQTRVITGRVRNYTEANYDNVAVTFDLLDASRAVVGQVRDSAAVVAPGGTWSFQIRVPRENVTKVRLVNYAATRRDGPRSNVDVMQDV